MKKFLMAAAAGTLTGVVVTTQVAAPLLAQEAAKATNVYEQLDLFGDIFERIRSQYVEEVDEADLIEARSTGCSPRSIRIPAISRPTTPPTCVTQTRGEFGGLGIEVTQEDGFVKVVSPIDDTPADEAGIEAGDFITHVDAESVLGLTLDEAVDLMRGPVGSEIVITIVREGETEPFRCLDHPRYHQADRRAHPNRGQDTVVLRVTTFNDQTLQEPRKRAAEQVEEAGGLENIRGIVSGFAQQSRRVADPGHPRLGRVS